MAFTMSARMPLLLPSLLQPLLLPKVVLLLSELAAWNGMQLPSSTAVPPNPAAQVL
jgi:hypothetical protein